MLTKLQNVFYQKTTKKTRIRKVEKIKELAAAAIRYFALCVMRRKKNIQFLLEARSGCGRIGVTRHVDGSGNEMS